MIKIKSASTKVVKKVTIELDAEGAKTLAHLAGLAKQRLHTVDGHPTEKACGMTPMDVANARKLITEISEKCMDVEDEG